MTWILNSLSSSGALPNFLYMYLLGIISVMREKLVDAKAPGHIKQCTRTCFFLLIYFVVADSLSKLTEKGINTSA